MYIIMVYSLRVKKQAQFILKIATVQEILQKNKREICKDKQILMISRFYKPAFVMIIFSSDLL